MVKLFYIQDSRKPVGDCMVFWRKEAAGYTINLDDAMVVTEAEAKRMCCRTTDVPWPKEYIDAKAQRHINLESGISLEEALAGRPDVDIDDTPVDHGRLARLMEVPLANRTGLFPPYSTSPLVTVGDVRKIAKAFEAARALLDPEGSLEASGVNPGPEREELEAALRDAG